MEKEPEIVETVSETLTEQPPTTDAVSATEQVAVPSVEKTVERNEEIKDKVIEKRSNKRILQGKVVSNKADKTIIVAIVRQVAHPLYKKYYKRTKKIMAHDENNECNVGDKVRVMESRPLSARKRWNLYQIVEKAK
jgi:small subunit ribosomal protein S17